MKVLTSIGSNAPLRPLLRMLLSLLLLCAASLASLQAQERLDGTLTIEGESRDYSLYIPSAYSVDRPNGVMLALHPQNTARWNGGSWCDTLTAFAEANGLILLCPDGGTDGSIINQKTDTLLITALLDSVQARYGVDLRRVYAMGFSVGGLATYLYGLANADRFAGYIPVGAAINGTVEIAPLLPRVREKPFYVVHGGADAAQSRYYPAIDGLEQNGALLRSLLMPGVGHTIDFPNRNGILTDAFRWIDSVNLARVASGVEEEEQTKKKEERIEEADILLRPHPVLREGEGTFRWPDGSAAEDVRVIDLLGRVRPDAGVTLIDRTSAKILPRNLSPGVYFLETVGPKGRLLLRFVVR